MNNREANWQPHPPACTCADCSKVRLGTKSTNKAPPIVCINGRYFEYEYEAKACASRILSSGQPCPHKQYGISVNGWWSTQGCKPAPKQQVVLPTPPPALEINPSPNTINGKQLDLHMSDKTYRLLYEKQSTPQSNETAEEPSSIKPQTKGKGDKSNFVIVAIFIVIIIVLIWAIRVSPF